MGGAVKSVTKPFIEGVQKVAGSLTGNKTAEAPAPAGPTQEELLAEIRDLLKK